MDIEMDAVKMPAAGVTGAEIQKHREEIGLTREQLSRYLGICTSTLKRWERSLPRKAGLPAAVGRRFLNGDFDRELKAVNAIPAEMKRRLAGMSGASRNTFLQNTMLLVRSAGKDPRPLLELARRMNRVVNDNLTLLLSRR